MVSILTKLFGHVARGKRNVCVPAPQTVKGVNCHYKDIGQAQICLGAVSYTHLDILAQRGVSVAHCPVSNMKLASGTAPVPQLLAKNITVGLGTDGASSNNSMNLMRDLSVCSFLHKLNNMDPTALSAYDILHMATIGGAKALGWEQEIGTLEVGKKADVILIDLQALHYYPHNNIISDLVYSSQGADVKTTIINGQVIMRDRRFINLDLEKVKAEMSQAARAITQN